MKVLSARAPQRHPESKLPLAGQRPFSADTQAGSLCLRCGNIRLGILVLRWTCRLSSTFTPSIHI